MKNRNSNGNLYVRYLKWDNLHFNWNYKWLNNDFNSNEPAALLATPIISPCYFGGEFFMICPCQPPSIFPTSSSFTERAMYLLSSRDFVSHSTIKNIFSVSILRMACFTKGSFSSLPKKLAVIIDSIAWVNSSSIFCPRE